MQKGATIGAPFGYRADEPEAGNLQQFPESTLGWYRGAPEATGLGATIAFSQALAATALAAPAAATTATSAAVTATSTLATTTTFLAALALPLSGVALAGFTSRVAVLFGAIFVESSTVRDLEFKMRHVIDELHESVNEGE